MLLRGQQQDKAQTDGRPGVQRQRDQESQKDEKPQEGRDKMKDSHSLRVVSTAKHAASCYVRLPSQFTEYVEAGRPS